MFKSRDNSSPYCSSSEVLVAYLYSELNATERSSFETHLVDCDLCTAELADLSFARLDVYEWHRDEFVEMATPRIAIPYGESSNVSWIDKVRAFFASPAQLVTAAGAFAVITLVTGLWFASSRTIETADALPGPSPIPVKSVSTQDRQSGDVPVSGDSNVVRSERPLGQTAKSADPEIVKTSAGRNVKAEPGTVKNQKNSSRQVQTRRKIAAPRLNDFEDEDDNTLRLGDLLAEVDTRD